MEASPRRSLHEFEIGFRRLSQVTAPLIRVVSGLSLAAHGYAILFGDHEAFASFFERAGFRPGLLWAILCGLVQFVGGLCFALGFRTRLVAVPILIFLLTAITYHWQFGFYWDVRGFEYPLFWSVVTFHFLVHGGGPYSLDALLGRGAAALHG
jgi:putative oxidoreductase